MKNPLLLFLLAISHIVCSQSSFYFKAGGGYAFPVPAYTIGADETNIFLRETDPETGNLKPAFLRTNSEVVGSYGSGPSFTGILGYKLSSTAAVELRADFVRGKTYQTKKTSQDIDDNHVMYQSDDKTKTAANSILLSSSFILHGPGDRISPYLSAGVVAGIFRLTSENETVSTYNGDIPQRSLREEYSGSLALGLRGGAGVNLKLTQTFGLFTELAFNAINFYPKEKEITQYILNGNDALSMLTKRQKHTKYVERFTSDTRNDNGNDENQPLQATRFSFSMSNLMLNTGVRITL